MNNYVIPVVPLNNLLSPIRFLIGQSSLARIRYFIKKKEVKIIKAIFLIKKQKNAKKVYINIKYHSLL